VDDSTFKGGQFTILSVDSGKNYWDLSWNDGIVCAVEMKTVSGNFKRLARNVCLYFIENVIK